MQLLFAFVFRSVLKPEWADTTPAGGETTGKEDSGYRRPEGSTEALLLCVDEKVVKRGAGIGSVDPAGLTMLRVSDRLFHHRLGLYQPFRLKCL